MKFKLLLSIAVAIATTLFIASCDDTLDTIGSGIQPDVDDIVMEADQVVITAETAHLGKDVYLRTNRALLGMFEDETLGSTKSDFMAELFTANAKFDVKFDNVNKGRIDSVYFAMRYASSTVVGDTLSPMGISIYELDKPLKPNFYTSVNPLDYTDKTTMLGQRYFIHSELPRGKSSDGVIVHNIYVDLNKSFGQKIYNAWELDPTVLNSPENLKKVTRGIYVTSDFNKKTLIELIDANQQLDVVIFYQYWTKKVHEPTVDSLVNATLPLQISGGALQLNSVIDTPNEELLKPYEKDPEKYDPKNMPRTYIKAPAGVVTKITIPLAEIREKAKKKTGSDKYTINSAVFSLTGMTEAEKKLGINKRPDRLLFINKDSIENFFLKSKTIDGISTLLMSRDGRSSSTGQINESSTKNTYHFVTMTSSGEARNNNISDLINHYIENEKDKAEKSETLEFYLIPIDMERETTTGAIYARNALSPSAAILRTDEDNMKMSLMFSKYSEIKGK